MIQDRKGFVTFLVEAKIHTYASESNFVDPTRPGSKELVFPLGGASARAASRGAAAAEEAYGNGSSTAVYEYRDVYWGGLQFLGQEMVTRDGAAFWGMNYYGHSLVSTLPPGFSEFLKEALRKVPAFSPYRGPRYHRSGALEYSCTWHGELEAFDGFETIATGGQNVYELHFHGGLII